MSESNEIEQIRRVVLGAMAFRQIHNGNFGQSNAEHVARAILPLIRAAEERGAVDMRERAAEISDVMRNKHSSPTGDTYTCGGWDMGVRISGKIRALPPTKEG